MSTLGRIPPAPDDDDEEWMATFRTLPDTEIDALLEGRAASTAAGGLGDLMHVLRDDATQHGPPPMSAELRTQIHGAAKPVRSAPRPRRVLAGLLGGFLVGGAAMGVAGAQDALPGPIQDATATVAGALGFDLPRSDDPVRPTSGDGDADVGTDGGSEAPPDQTPAATDGPAGEPDPAATQPDPTRPPQAPPESTPGGAVPADPGTPGDGEPATPATPATGNGPGTGNGPANGNGNGNGTGTGQGNNGTGTGGDNSNHASEVGQTNGRGTDRP